MANSISDSFEYKNFCKLASKNDEVFQTFKTNPIYNGILEHVSYEQGLLYLEYINKNFPEFITKLTGFKKNDILGTPVTFSYEGVGIISPTTLRYIKVLSDLKSLYGDLSGKKVVEIGVGYGGQCLILNQFFDIKEYVLIDLDDALSLSSKYLSKLNVNHRIVKIDEVSSLEEDFDIVISNYAYSELSKELQDLYYDKVISKSKNGYFTFNFVSDMFGINSYSYDGIMNKFSEKNVKVMSEYPETFENNKILYFNQIESYSQVEQDLWVLEMLKNKKNGFFLDIGAFDGIKFSNTYLLEKHYGWKGILIEAQPETFKVLQSNRINTCLNYAITNKTGQVTFDNFSYTGSKISDNGVTVNSITFKDLFHLYGVPRVVDYMSLDIEGNEYQSLLEFPFKDHICNLITVEHNLYNSGSENKEKIHSLLTLNGYVLIKENVECENNPFEDWYAHESFVGKRSLIFDIGAHSGQFTDKCLIDFPNSKIITIEANEELYFKLVEKYSSNNRVVVLQYLISQKNANVETLMMAEESNFISTSSIERTQNTRYNHHNWNKKVNIRTTNLDTLIKIFGEPDLIKIDVQGYEFEVISGLTKKSGQICFGFLEEEYDKINKSVEYLSRLGYTSFGYTDEENYHKIPKIYCDWSKSNLHNIINKNNQTLSGVIWSK